MSKNYRRLALHFRDNENRKSGKKTKGKHPGLVFGETLDRKKYLNIGLTHSDKRGHHKNVEIHDPEDWKKKSYLRDDVKLDDKSKLKVILKGYHLNPKDEDKVLKIIAKYEKKNSH